MFKLNAAKRHRVHQAIEIFQKRNPEPIRLKLKEAGYDDLTEEAMLAAGSGSTSNVNTELDLNADAELELNAGLELNAEVPDDPMNEPEDTEAARKKSLKSQRMRLRTRVVRGMWAEAPEEERTAVEAEVEREKQELREAELREEQERKDGLMAKTPRDLQE